MRAVGIDAGSLTTKAVVMGGGGVLSSAVVRSSDSAEASARAALEEALARAGGDRDSHVVSTGAGARGIPFSRQSKAITTCLARGVHYLLPEARTAIDMGAESITVVRINERGRVSDCGNQDKCAAGTGLFLEQMGRLLGLSLEEMARISAGSSCPAEITGTCAVFAESEVISHIHRDPPTPVADIVAGIYRSMVHRIMAQLQRVGVREKVAVTGGAAANRGLVAVLEPEVGRLLHRGPEAGRLLHQGPEADGFMHQGSAADRWVLVPPSPELAGAIGAALIALENMAPEGAQG